MKGEIIVPMVKTMKRPRTVTIKIILRVFKKP